MQPHVPWAWQRLTAHESRPRRAAARWPAAWRIYSVTSFFAFSVGHLSAPPPSGRPRAPP
eukprot:scaffold15386_cov57-Phaeocystis_antarctica.AAC.7